MSDDELHELCINIGRRITKRREQLGLTQEGLAKKSGISNKHISIIENGSNMKLSSTVKICRALGMDYTYLFTGNDTLENTPLILGKLSSLSKRQYDVILSNIDTFIEDNDAIKRAKENLGCMD